MEVSYDTHCTPYQRVFARAPTASTRGQRPYLYKLCLQLPTAVHVCQPPVWCATFRAVSGADRCPPGDGLLGLSGDRTGSPTTRNARLAAIKSFMHFVEYRVPALLEQIRRVLAIPTKRTDQPLIQHLSLVEMQAILNAPALQTRSGIRDRAMLHVCFAAGLRVSELVMLPLTALTWQPTPTIHIQGKGRRHRALPLWQHTAEDVRAWLAVRGDVAVPELFISHQGRAMTRVGFTYLLRKYVHRIGKFIFPIPEAPVNQG
jgi:integrase